MSEQAAESVVFHELPDPLIADFMNRVLRLDSSQWDSLIGESIPLWKFPIRMWFKRIKVLVSLRAVNKLVVASSTIGCADPLVLNAYTHFAKNLTTLGLPLEVRSMVAGSLFALRSRDNVFARPYDAQLARVIPLASLGNESEG